MVTWGIHQWQAMPKVSLLCGSACLCAQSAHQWAHSCPRACSSSKEEVWENMSDLMKAQSRRHGTWYPTASHILVSTLPLLHWYRSFWVLVSWKWGNHVGKTTGFGGFQYHRTRAPPRKSREPTQHRVNCISLRCFRLQVQHVLWYEYRYKW